MLGKLREVGHVYAHGNIDADVQGGLVCIKYIIMIKEWIKLPQCRFTAGLLLEPLKPVVRCFAVIVVIIIWHIMLKFTILLGVLYGCIYQSLTLKEAYKFQVSENSARIKCWCMKHGV
jgi:hypothetical protein